jgi:hypothetical protein
MFTATIQEQLHQNKMFSDELPTEEGEAGEETLPKSLTQTTAKRNMNMIRKWIHIIHRITEQDTTHPQATEWNRSKNTKRIKVELT